MTKAGLKARGVGNVDCRMLFYLSRLLSSGDANAAIEFALIGPVLAVMMLNAVDFSFLIWARMQVDNAAEMGAQAAYATCSPGTMPATTNCSTLTSAVTTAVQSTSLGTAVTVASGSPSETYYCTISGDSLQSVGSPPSSMPADCSGAGSSYAGNVPGDYVTVIVNYTYNPLFGGLSLAPSQTLSSFGIQRLK